MTAQTIYTRAFLAGVILATATAGAQQMTSRPTTDLAVTYTLERAKITGAGCGCFWLNGGSTEVAVSYQGWGIAANFTGGHAANISPGVNLDKVTLTAGPRFTLKMPVKHKTRVFAEALFGGMHGFDSVFPKQSGTYSSSSSVAFVLGGGVDVVLAKGLGLHLPEVDYVHSSLANGGSNSQNDLRLAFGLSYRFGQP